MIRDRLDTRQFADTLYTEPAQVLRLGEERAGLLLPWLDEMATLSIDDGGRARFLRMQALWHSIIDQVAPLIRISRVRTSSQQRARIRPTVPRYRAFRAVRIEVRQVRDVLPADITRPWTLSELAASAYLSTRLLSHVCAETYGKTPLAYLTMLRVQKMARLLRDTELTIAAAGRRVGWRS